MAEIVALDIEVTSRDLLQAIWYSEGNRKGVNLTDIPDSFRVLEATVTEGIITLRVELWDEESDPS